MYCMKCKQEIKNGIKFCPICGTAFVDEENKKLAEIVLRLQKGEADAFNEFYIALQKYVSYVVLKNLNNRTMAEDVAQEVFVSAYQKIHTLEDPYKVKGWISSIAHNAAVDALKKEQKYVLISENDQEEQANSFFDRQEETDVLMLPEKAMEQQELQELLQSFMRELPDNQKIVLKKYFYEGKTLKEISEETKIPENSVKTYMRRGKLALQNKIETWSKKTGQKLYAVPFAPVLYVAFRGELQKAVSSAIVTKGSVKAAKTAAKKAAKTSVKIKVAKAVAGVTAAAVVGTGTVGYLTNEKIAIKRSLSKIEEACETLNEEELREYLSEDTLEILDMYHIALTREYDPLGLEPKNISAVADFDLEIKEIETDEDTAEVVVSYVDRSSGEEEVTDDIELRMVKEDRKWKLDTLGEQDCYQISNQEFYELVTEDINFYNNPFYVGAWSLNIYLDDGEPDYYLFYSDVVFEDVMDEHSDMTMRMVVYDDLQTANVVWEADLKAIYQEDSYVIMGWDQVEAWHYGMINCRFPEFLKSGGMVVPGEQRILFLGLLGLIEF